MEEKHLKQHIKGSHTHERNHQCTWEGCTKSFLTATRLRRHEAAHGGHERFRCTEYSPCNQTFRKHQTLQRHIRSDHLQLTPFPCTHIDPITKVQCNAGYDSAGALRKHEDRIHGALRFWCDECTLEGADQPAGFATKAQFAKHIRSEHANCLFCDLKCSSERELQRHIETFHAVSSTLPGRKQIPCTYPGCEKSFTKKYNLDVHVRTAHEGQRFICGQADLSRSVKLEAWDGSDACGKDFVSKVNLEDHVRTQHLGLPSTVNARRVKKNSIGAKPRKAKSVSNDVIGALTGDGYAQDPARNIPCDIEGCDWMFSRGYDLIQHKRIKHGIEPSVSGTAIQIQDSHGIRQCDIPGCPERYANEIGLMQHKRHGHGIAYVFKNLSLPPPGTAPFIVCELGCNWLFSTRDSLRYHKLVTHRMDLGPLDAGFLHDEPRKISCDAPGCASVFYLECRKDALEAEFVMHMYSHGIVFDYYTSPEVQATSDARDAEEEAGLMERLMTQPKIDDDMERERLYKGPPHYSDDPRECTRLNCPHWDHEIIYDDYYGFGDFMADEDAAAEPREEKRNRALGIPESPPDFMSAAAYELGI